MANEPSVYGFSSRVKAEALSRFAENAGLVSRVKESVKYPHPLAQPGMRIVLAALTAELAQGGTATARIIRNRDGNFYWSDQDEITVYDFFFNVDESAPADTKIACLRYDGIYVALVIYCEPSDTLPEETDSGGSSGGGSGTGGGTGTGGVGTGGAVAGGAPGFGLGDVMLGGPDNFTEPGFLPQEAL